MLTLATPAVCLFASKLSGSLEKKEKNQEAATATAPLTCCSGNRKTTFQNKSFEAIRGRSSASIHQLHTEIYQLWLISRPGHEALSDGRSESRVPHQLRV